MGRAPVFTFCVLLLACYAQLAELREFPKNFKFGTASSAYQSEGGWNADGKGVSVWDYVARVHPESFANGSNGDVAADTYHKYKEDVQLLKHLGVQHYRFSISWTRVLPNGDTSVINEAGLRYYNNLINELIAHGIAPMVTIYHWDMPIGLGKMGGMNNTDIVDYFVDFADVLFKRFGDRVPYWITFNEPLLLCSAVEFHNSPPYFWGGLTDNNYVCTHRMLQAHAKMYALYKEKYAHNKGRVGITLSAEFAFPKDPNNPDDVAAANREMQFSVGQYANPIFGKTGDYPPIVKTIVDANSKAEGLKTSRLPKLTAKEKASLKGSADFFGLNYYSGNTYTSSKGCESCPFTDEQVIAGVDPSWKQSSSPWLFSVPEGLRQILNWIRTEYSNPEVMITENGWSDSGELHDVGRIDYLQSHLNATLDAIDDGCNVTAHTTWAFVDDLEWTSGYGFTFGLYKVDFNSPQRTRTAKSSLQYLRNVIKRWKLL